MELLYLVDIFGRMYVPINTWIHVGIVYRGPNEGEGITIYHDGVYKGSDTTLSSYTTVYHNGVKKGSDTTLSSYTRNPPSGKVKFGR